LLNILYDIHMQIINVIDEKISFNKELLTDSFLYKIFTSIIYPSKTF